MTEKKEKKEEKRKTIALQLISKGTAHRSCNTLFILNLIQGGNEAQVINGGEIDFKEKTEFCGEKLIEIIGITTDLSDQKWGANQLNNLYGDIYVRN